jgi:uncharacterized protein YwgA
MMDTVDLVVGIVALNGGKLVGKTRLQKVAYLLDACGMGSGVDYDYHHFGPYSAEVASAADAAEALGRVVSQEKPGFHSVPYVVYETHEEMQTKLGNLSADEVSRKLRMMKGYSAIELELAATIHYLENAEGYSPAGAQEEVKLRKAAKASSERLVQANRLLGSLGLRPAVHLAT